MPIHLGDSEDGQRVEIPVFHTGIFGQTGVGKTKLLKYMLSQATKEGFRVLIIDSKIPNAEFEGIGVDVPLYLEESTDPDIFRSLIEQMRTKGRGNMERFRGGFIELCSPPGERAAENFSHIGARLAQKLEDKKIKGYTRAMYSEIQHDYNKLMKLIGNFQFAKTLELPGKINRMATRELPSIALQGLVVRSVIEEIMRRGEKNLIVLIDEAPNFCHQEHYNPAKEAIQQLDAQGRSQRLFGWYSGQTLTGFDKSNMKNLWYWAIGREMETNEAKAAHAVQTTKVLTVDGIRKLKVREFVAVTPEITAKITVPHIEEEADPLGAVSLSVQSKEEPGKRKRVVHSETGLMGEEKEGGEVSWKTYNEVRNMLTDAEAKNVELEKRASTLESQLEQIKATLAHNDQELGPLREKLQAEKDRADRLLKERDELAFSRSEMARFLWPVLKSYIGEMPAKAAIANNDGQVEVGAEDVEVVVVEKTRMEKFDEGGYEGKLAILLNAGFFSEPRNEASIQKEITRQWGVGWGSNSKAALKAAIERFTQRPYLLLASDGATRPQYTATEKGNGIKKEALVE